MKRWILEERMEDGRVIVRFEWRGIRTGFRKKWGRWVIGDCPKDTYPIVRGSPVSLWDEHILLDLIHTVRRVLLPERRATDA